MKFLNIHYKLGLLLSLCGCMAGTEPSTSSEGTPSSSFAKADGTDEFGNFLDSQEDVGHAPDWDVPYRHFLNYAYSTVYLPPDGYNGYGGVEVELDLDANQGVYWWGLGQPETGNGVHQEITVVEEQTHGGISTPTTRTPGTIFVERIFESRVPNELFEESMDVFRISMRLDGLPRDYEELTEDQIDDLVAHRIDDARVTVALKLEGAHDYRGVFPMQLEIDRRLENTNLIPEAGTFTLLAEHPRDDQAPLRTQVTLSCPAGAPTCLATVSLESLECPFPGSELDCEWTERADALNDYENEYETGGYVVCDPTCERFPDVDDAIVDAANTASFEQLRQHLCGHGRTEGCLDADTIMGHRDFVSVEDLRGFGFNERKLSKLLQLAARQRWPLP